MKRLLVGTLLFLATNTTLADVKNKEKAKFELISSIEILVNIDECRKDIQAHPADNSVLPRACNILPYLSKYFFDPNKDKIAIEEYLNNEEAKVTEDALKLLNAYKFKNLGKMTLSDKCVKSRDPVDLDSYLNKIKGIPIPKEEGISAIKVDSNKLEIRNPAQEEL
ncbi:MAG: hypothetical protein V4596_13590 [Bdellovibrionota bacterium]